MGRKSHTQTLLCLMNELPVGVLIKRGGQLSFQYHKEWLDAPIARPISLSLPLQEQPHESAKIHAYFENLLPDNSVIRQHIVDRLGAKSIHPFDLLRVVGADCIGALTFVDDKNPTHSEKPDCLPLKDTEIAGILKKASLGGVLGMEPNEDFRISLAGAQEKTALTFKEGQWYKPIGSMPTTHILKLPIHTNAQFGPDLSNSVENEYFCMSLMRNLEFNVAKVEIVNFEDMKALSVERFDRKITKGRLLRLPQEDFCQALGVVSGSKYEEQGGPGISDIMSLLSNSIKPYEDRSEFMRAQLVFWLLAAIDAHAKNYSIFLRPEGFHLTPFYDVLSAIPYFGQGNMQPKKVKMAMALIGKNRHYRWDGIQPRHFLETAKSVGFASKEMEGIIGQTKESFPLALAKTVDDLPSDFDRGIVESIEQHASKKLKLL